MSDITYRARLKSPQIPVDPLTPGRTTVLQGNDGSQKTEDRERLIASPDGGTAQVLYCANVLPTEYGFRSMHYYGNRSKCPGTPYAATVLRIPTGKITLIHTLEGDLYRIRNLDIAPDHQAYDTTADPYFIYMGNFPGKMSTAVVSGAAYVMFGSSLYELNFKLEEVVVLEGPASTQALTRFTVKGSSTLEVTLQDGTTFIETPIPYRIVDGYVRIAGVYPELPSSPVGEAGDILIIRGFQYPDPAKHFVEGSNSIYLRAVEIALPFPNAIDVIGILGVGGYLLIYSSDLIAWSSLVDATDFTPSADTGAAYASVEGIRGPITCCVSTPSGFLVFTEANCVVATKSDNAAYPFNFREVVGSSGVTDPQRVAFEGNNASVYAYTSVGFQQIAYSGLAKPAWTELYHDGNATPLWTEHTVVASGNVQGIRRQLDEAKLVSVGSRYICISVKSQGIYKAIWVYDTGLQRWGRLLVDHLEVFETVDYRIGIIESDGKVSHVDTCFSESDPDTSKESYLALGRFQYSRQRLTQMQAIQLDNLVPENLYWPVTQELQWENKYPKVFLLASSDGIGGSFVEAYQADQFGRYLIRKTGVNHIVLVKGDFILNTLELTFNNHGGR